MTHTMRTLPCLLAVTILLLSAGTVHADAPEVTLGKHHEMLIDGKLFLPVHAWAVADKDLDRLKAMGVNVALLCGDAGMGWHNIDANMLARVKLWLGRVHQRGMYAGLTVSAWWASPQRRGTLAGKGVEAYIEKFKDHPALLLWQISVEEDMGIGKKKLQAEGVNEWRPRPNATAKDLAERYRVVKKADPKHPVLVMYSGGQMLAADRKFGWTLPTPEKFYYETAKHADILYHDLFPVANNTANDLKQIADATKLLVKYTRGRKHLWVAVDAGDRKRWTTKSHAPTGEEIRCELWQAIVHGAHGLGFDYTGFNPWASIRMSADGEKGLTAAVKQIEQLKAPILLGRVEHALQVTSAGDGKVDATLRRHGGKTYIFAVNVEAKPCEATIKPLEPKLTAGKAKVLGEDRTVDINGGKIKDRFDARAVHLYEIAE
ncbi:MAG TPA: hypothetical protein VNA25_23525 [Phycisphaerae bacterium]|nr:hypothetical protein [Phycisphaerae bacterium]